MSIALKPLKATLILTLLASSQTNMTFALITTKVTEFAAKPFVRAALEKPNNPGSVLSFFLVRLALYSLLVSTVQPP